MIHTILIYALAMSTITATPQFVTFKDGKIGVNFGGYTAEAGLGGFLTGNAAHGGLSASAGTPFGQRAAAGIGGLVNGDAAGRAYAGAQATDSIGASAIIGGSTGPQQRGLIGAEAHSNGNAVTKTITSDTNINGNNPHDSAELVVPTDLPKERGVQRIKPPKKYTTLTSIDNPVEFGQNSVPISSSSELPNLIAQETPAVYIVKGLHHHGARRHKHNRPATRRHINLYKQISYAPLPSQRFNGDEEQIKTAKTTYEGVQKVGDSTLIKRTETTSGNQDVYHVAEKDVQVNPGALNQFFNIPIGILQSIRDNLQPLGVRKQVSYTSAV